MKRTHLLMGIPELHLGAFSPEAGRMKLYCGGGGGRGDNGAAERARQEAQRQAEENARRIAELEAAAAAQRAAEQAAQAAAAKAAEEAAAKAAADKAAADAAQAKATSDAAYAAQSPKYVAAGTAGKSSLRIDTGMNPYGASQRGRFGLGVPGSGNGLGI